MTNRREMLFSAGQSEPNVASRSLRIIVADDDRDAVMTLMMVLRHEGHEVRGAHKGADVLQAMRSFEPDALIADINMPEMSGYELARRVSATYLRKPLLIGVSGVYKKPPDALIARAVGFDHYLTNPYEPSDVLRLLAPLRHPSAPQS